MGRDDERTVTAPSEGETLPFKAPGSASGGDAPGTLPVRYRTLDALGSGGMGEVVRAFDSVLGREVAIKRIHANIATADIRQRFAREARAAASLRHPNVVEVYDVDLERGFLVMELVEGETLRARMKRGDVDSALVRSVAEGVLAALEAAHAAGIVHRDIKPANIMIRPGGRIVLVDFGLARRVDDELTRTGESYGTPAYMSPEQLRGAVVDARSDLYSLGATLFHASTGEKLEGMGLDVQSRRKLRAASADRALVAVVEGALRPDRADRFESATSARRALATPPPRFSWPARVGVVSGAVAILALTFDLGPSGPDATMEPAVDAAFEHAQDGDHERAARDVGEYLAEHPEDPDALTVAVLVDWWLTAPGLPAAIQRALRAPLRPPQRALVEGVYMLEEDRIEEAIAFLRDADARHPGAPEILYILGESLWHGERRDDGAATLERAFVADTRWRIALHHVVEHRLARGEPSALASLLPALAARSPSEAACLEEAIALAGRDVVAATAAARVATELAPDSPNGWARLAEALTLAGHFDEAERAALAAFERSPVDDREVAGFGHLAEQRLYAGDLAGYLDATSEGSRIRGLLEIIWRARPGPAVEHLRAGGVGSPAIWVAAYVERAALLGDAEGLAFAERYPDDEVRALGRGLGAERRDDRGGALAAYEAGLAAPTQGALRMLLAHHAARVQVRAGDAAGARASCGEVLWPRVYQVYRAIVLADCLEWSGELDADDRHAPLLRAAHAARETTAEENRGR